MHFQANELKVKVVLKVITIKVILEMNHTVYSIIVIC